MSQPPGSVPGLGVPAGLMPKFDNSLGALLIGGLFAMALWGVTCVQAYSYFMNPTRDRFLFKLAIAGLWLLDTFDSALNAHILYHYMVTNYLNPLAIIEPVWSICIHVALTSLSNFMIRSMFAHRVYRLSNKNIPLTAWLVAVSALDLAVGLYITVIAFKLTTFLQLDDISKYMYLNFSSATASDLSLALALCYLLYHSRTGFRKTDSLIKILMLYTVNTGLVVAIDAALGMIMYAVMPHNLIFLAFYLLLSKLYLNSYLATLNARRDLRKAMDDTVSIHLSQLSQLPRYDHGSSATSGEKTRTETLAVSVQTLVDQKVDQSGRDIERTATRGEAATAY
ncbi:hypothetical protein AX17_005634 [Amanita inopinata Kibby_2008]|nr:hypothetical protein AX17_005634 [Amanita inopinata Kibby_2008]